MKTLLVLGAAILFGLFTVLSVLPTSEGKPLPTRAAFFYPWFPSTWGNLADPFTNYTPTFGFYDSQDDAVIDQELSLAKRANIDAFISSWWGQGHHTDAAVQHILDRTQTVGSPVEWSLYYEEEGQGDPTVAEIVADLQYMKANIFNKPSYMRIKGSPVLFVYADGGDGAGMAERWSQARTLHPDIYLVLKVYSGYRSDPNQPDSWHQYGPAGAYDEQLPYSASISPGFWKKGEGPRLVRDLARFSADVDRMVASGADWQLITTWNEWGEGTQIEPSLELGQAEIDVLCRAGGTCPDLPTPTSAPTNTPGPSPTPGASVTLVGAGDISTCANDNDEATALLLDSIPGTIFTAGDNAYEDGTAAEFANCYNPTWGRHKDRTRPAPGNHDYHSGGGGYFDYFGANAGPVGRGYYSYDLAVGAWHVISLNSSCGDAGGCGAGSPQEQWLRADLAATTANCVVAYWHHARFSSSDNHGSDTRTQALWQALYDFQADIVIAGHDHIYERFGKQDASGNVDPNGIRSFVAGTGGRSHYGIGAAEPNSEVRNGDTFGVLRLTLRAADYDWEFVPVAGQAFTDSGTDQCVDAPTPPTATPVPPTATQTPVPTDTPTPLPTATFTPLPTDTQTPVPPTSTPTNTPVPTDTPPPLCEVLVRIDGVEQWVVKPLPFCLE